MLTIVTAVYACLSHIIHTVLANYSQKFSPGEIFSRIHRLLELVGKKFFMVLSWLNDDYKYIEDMTTLTALVKLYSTLILALNAKVAWGWKTFV